MDRERFVTPSGRESFYPYSGPQNPIGRPGERRRGLLRVREVQLPSPLPSGSPGNDAFTARLLFRPDVEARQPVVFLHGFGFSLLRSWESIPAAFAARGHPSVILCLPHLCERARVDRPPGHHYTSTNAETALPAYEQAVADTRAALDWALEQPECASVASDPDMPGPAVVGVSFGALVAVIAAALESRFESLVSLLGGADLEIIVFRGSYRTGIERQLRDAKIGIEQRRTARAMYEEYLDRVRAATRPLDVPAPFHFYLFDPLTFAPHLRERPALLMNARFDPVMPRSAAEQLRLELGCPEASWFWGTHLVAGPWLPYVARRVTRYLAARRPGERRIPLDTRAAVWVP